MDGWLEPRTRIPFVGIIAMVLIVAVVAIFIKTQLQPLFPESEIIVEDQQALTGRASSSFYGEREVELQRKELLRGSLNRDSEALVFTVDAPNQVLTIDSGAREEEILLTYNDGLLVADFEYNAVQTSVAVDAASRALTFGTEHTVPTDIGLGDEVVYLGSFSYKGATHNVQLHPAVQELRIGDERIPVTKDGKIFHGTWDERPFTVDMEDELLKIEEIY